MKPSSQDITAVCDYVQELCGIYLDETKDYLIESRLSSLVEQYACSDYLDLTRRAQQTPSIQDEVVNAITTNETLWFRDASPFEALRYKIIPELLDAKAGSVNPRRLRIWSAACSTGQEVYSLAMTFADVVGADFEDWDLQILGTDISPAAVDQARQGKYSDLELSRGLSQEHQGAYLVRPKGQWEVNDLLRKKCRFEVRNLLEPFDALEPVDIIFCRNVSIYFTPEDRRSLFLRLSEKLHPGGWLFAGSGESLVDLGETWKPFHHCRAVCYQPNGCNGVATLGR